MGKSSKMRIVDVESPIRTFYDNDLDFEILNEINKSWRDGDENEEKKKEKEKLLYTYQESTYGI